MSKPKPTVQSFMTSNVETVPSDKSLKDAIAIMQAKKIRHLPIVMNGRVVGIISDRDIKAALSMKGVDPAKSLVHYFCTDAVYTVSPDMPLDKVSEVMAEHHYGSAVVTKNDEIVGIITVVDICKALAYLIRQHYH